MIMNFHLSTKSIEEVADTVAREDEAIVWRRYQSNDGLPGIVVDEGVIHSQGGAYVINEYNYDKSGKVVRRWHDYTSGLIQAYKTAISRI